VSYVALLGLSLFFGFAFEEFYGGENDGPGGVRTFPLVAFAGAALYLVEPRFALAFIAGLFVLGAWLYKSPRGELIKAVCVVIAYVLGPIALTQPLWIPVALTVAAVLLVGSRNALHALVSRVPKSEVLTLAQFLLLVGVVLPVLYGAPRIPYTQITPFNVWLAVVAVSTLSYASYALQRYVLPKSGIIVAGALGGLYSSTATTVVLARTARDEGMSPHVTAAIVAATAMMYVRMLVIVAIFNSALARALVLPMLILAALAVAVAAVFARMSDRAPAAPIAAVNPLRLGTALVFAALLIAISLLSRWVEAQMGAHGVLALAVVVGVTDIDPFVLSLAQGGAATIGPAVAAVAIVVATSSNNVLKAIYTLAFARVKAALVPAGMLVAFCALGAIAAGIMTR